MAFNFFFIMSQMAQNSLAKEICVIIWQKSPMWALGGPWADPASRGAVDAAHGRMVES